MRPPSADTIEAEIREAMRGDDWPTVARLAAMLDVFDETRRNQREAVSLHAAALYYASIGLRVFPVRPGGKQPLGGHGFKDATTDPDQIERWWTAEPNANIGIATGHLVDVIDIDGVEGVRSWARMDDLPPIIGKVSTPRPGGNHLYIAPTGDRNGARWFPGIDYRGVGGYVVAPPSVTNLGSYAWYTPLALPPVTEDVA